MNVVVRVDEDFVDQPKIDDDQAELGILHLAEREFRAALKLQPGLLEARENLGITLGRLGELEAAVAELRKVLAARPNSAETHYNLGHALMQSGEFRQAVEAYRLAHELGSKNPRWTLPSAEWLRNAERQADLDASVWVALAATLFATINIAGGFLVTRRMLAMFRK